MSNSVVHVVARFEVQSGHVDEFIAQARRTLVEPTQGEPGCIRYELCQDTEKPTGFAMLESWESEDALGVHLAQASLQAVVAALAPMASGAPTVQRFRGV